MALTVTPGASDADSYSSLADAEIYHAARLHNEAWTAATDSDKEKGLKWAASILDGQSWLGWKATEDQALRWPRMGVYDPDGYAVDDSTIPAFLASAAAELAFALLSEDITETPAGGDLKSLTVDVLSLDFREASKTSVNLPTPVRALIRTYVIGNPMTAKVVRT